MESSFIIHAVATFFMTGLCYFVQLVHYPLFHEIALESFPAYERRNFITGYLTIPLMIVELVSGIYLLYQNIELLYFLNVALMGVIGLSTLLFQVPLHLKLSRKASPELIRKLINTNWIRTINWTLRAAILCILMSRF